MRIVENIFNFALNNGVENSRTDTYLLIRTLKSNVEKMLDSFRDCKEKNDRLRKELSSLKEENRKLLESLNKAEESLNAEMFSESLSGDSETKNKVREKIDLLIEQVDDCIKYWSLNS